MKNREQIYRKEAAELLRDISTYHFIRHDQLLRLYPNKTEKIENLLSYLVRQGRIFYDADSDMYHDGTEARPDMHSIAALWVLIDFIEKTAYHSAVEFPASMIFIAGEEIYEVIYVPSDNTALIEHALAQNKPDGKRIVITEDASIIPTLRIEEVTAYCTVSETGQVQYYKQS